MHFNDTIDLPSMEAHRRVRVAAALVVLEAVLTAAVIWRVAYTEIDWIAYMQEVAGALGGQLDYAQLRGDTGPLVYPAGFVYVYSALYWLTDHGTDVFVAQCVFWGVYLATCAVVLAIYNAAGVVPVWALALLCLSKRVHSIFVLRLFNDPVAMLLLYVAVYCATRDRWRVATVLLSLATSVKMNILLFAPGFGMLLVERFGLPVALLHVLAAVAIQLVLGAPFLAVNAVSYVHGAFDFGRQFFHVWTVNWKFLPEDVFVDRRLAVALLVAHVAVLALFFFVRWARHNGGLVALLTSRTTIAKPSPERIVSVLFTCNFIGIVFARSLHYQFYSWYFHALPFLLWQTAIPTVLKVALLAAIEVCWNVYPSTWWSSVLLQLCHHILLVGLLVFYREKRKTL